MNAPQHLGPSAMPDGPLVAAAISAERCMEASRQHLRHHRLDEAEAALRAAIGLRPDHSLAFNDLGWIRQTRGDARGATDCYRRALEIDPFLGIARRNLAPLLVQQGRFDESLELWHSEMLADPAGTEWANHMISEAMEARDLTLAGEYAELFARLRWSTRWYPTHRRGDSDPPLAPVGPPVYLSIPKLLHDIEQFQYLQRRGVRGDELTPIIAHYERIVGRLRSSGFEARVPLDSDATRTIGSVYNRIIHVRNTPRLGRALSDQWDAAAIESHYLDQPPGIVVVDDFLTDEALKELQQFCLESTVWSANRYGHGRLGAFFREGFNCPLLLQIAEEIRDRLPRVIGSQFPLKQLWGFKNAASAPAHSTLHADFAAVNVNFWITRNEANLDQGSGGFIVYEVDAPLDWDFYTYNGRADLIRDYLHRHQARAIYIPYRQNRAVIFNSDLFHETAEVRFGPDYEDRRINITMLYGNRENDRHHPRPRLGAPLGSPISARGAWRSASFSRRR